MSPCSRADKKFLVLPVSVSSVPEETQRARESGTQRAGRGAVILRLPVQHPAVGLQGECLESGVQDGSVLGAGMRYSDSKSSIP